MRIEDTRNIIDLKFGGSPIEWTSTDFSTRISNLILVDNLVQEDISLVEKLKADLVENAESYLDTTRISGILIREYRSLFGYIQVMCEQTGIELSNLSIEQQDVNEEHTTIGAILTQEKSRVNGALEEKIQSIKDNEGQSPYEKVKQILPLLLLQNSSILDDGKSSLNTLNLLLEETTNFDIVPSNTNRLAPYIKNSDFFMQSYSTMGGGEKNEFTEALTKIKNKTQAKEFDTLIKNQLVNYIKIEKKIKGLTKNSVRSWIFKKQLTYLRSLQQDSEDSIVKNMFKIDEAKIAIYKNELHLNELSIKEEDKKEVLKNMLKNYVNLNRIAEQGTIRNPEYLRALKDRTATVAKIDKLNQDARKIEQNGRFLKAWRLKRCRDNLAIAGNDLAQLTTRITTTKNRYKTQLTALNDAFKNKYNGSIFNASVASNWNGVSSDYRADDISRGNEAITQRIKRQNPDFQDYENRILTNSLFNSVIRPNAARNIPNVQLPLPQAQQPDNTRDNGRGTRSLSND